MAVSCSEFEPILPHNSRNNVYDSITESQNIYILSPPQDKKIQVIDASDESGKASRPEFCRTSYCRFINKNTKVSNNTDTFSPTWKRVSRCIALGLSLLLIWGTMYTVVGGVASPEGQLFKIGILGVLSYLAGWIISFISLPPLLGMLLMGVLLRNIDFIFLTGDYVVLAADLRKIALAIILVRAGLGLDPEAMKRLLGMVIKLAVFPSIMEAAAITVMSHYFLDLPWMWGMLVGTVMAAVSPAVVVPCLFSLQERGYGRSKGIPTLVIAAAAFDDIIAISGFGVVISIVFATDDVFTPIIRGPIGLLAGFIYGIVWGFVLRHIPHINDPNMAFLRTTLLGGGSLLVLFGSEMAGYEGAGPLGCIVAAFVASSGWRKQGWTEDNNPVSDHFANLWAFFQPILFGLIGTEIDLFFLDLKTVGLGAACLAVSLSSRILISVLMAGGGNLNWKEKLFVSWAWFPKATVQAAIGPVALDMAREIKSEEDEAFASKVLIMAVLSILITAPLGAFLINILGPRLLQREHIPEVESNLPPEQQNGCDEEEITASQAFRSIEVR